MKLEVGMYIRTKITDNCNCVYIRKIDEIDDGETLLNQICIDEDVCDGWGDERIWIDIEDISKASYNIIEILQIRDVITTNNLCGEITKIDIENNKIWVACCDYEICRSEDIKSIVTKEMMESISYKVN